MPSDQFSSFANITNVPQQILDLRDLTSVPQQILELRFFPLNDVKIHDIPIGHAVFT